MDVPRILALTASIVYYTPYVILAIGNTGCICNFITFTAKQLRQNSCGWYFLMSALFDFLYINFGLFTKLASEQYGSTLQNTNLVWCRIRVYFTWVLPCFATGYMVLAAIDRCLSTSVNTRLRSFSQLKVAYRMTCIPIILYSLTTSHQFVYYNLLPKCVPLPGIYSIFLSIYSIVWTSLIPQSCMLIFGLITYYNIRKSHQRLARPIGQPQRTRTRTDSQMIKITLLQVLCSSILLNIRTIDYAYDRLSTSIPKNDYRLAVEALIFQITSFIFYLNFSKSFFVNTLSSTLFRKVFKQRFAIFYQRIGYGTVRVQPISTTRTDRAELKTAILQGNIAIQTVA